MQLALVPQINPEGSNVKGNVYLAATSGICRYQRRVLLFLCMEDDLEIINLASLGFVSTRLSEA